jgi:Tfp pilus assembly protein PilX
MSKAKEEEKATALFLVLSIMFVVLALANVILSFMHSQSRLTHHQVSRIQAYYAAQAAMNYAFEKLRTGEWVAGIDCTEAAPCHAPGDIPLDFSNAFYPPSINYINVTIAPQAGSPITGTNPVNVTVDYQYSPVL